MRRLIGKCLYMKVQKNMTESMLADYRRWLFDKSKPKKVESLRQWLIRETEFLTTAAETIKGLGPLKDSRQQHHHMFRENKKWDQKRSRQKCPECKHPIWRCNQCESLDVKNRWISAKKNRLCYQCLGPNHLGNHCKKKENVTLMDVKKHTTGCCRKKLLYRKQRIRINQLMRGSQAHKQEKAV